MSAEPIDATEGAASDVGPSPAHADIIRRLRSGGIWVAAARLCGISSTVLANVLVARWAAPKEFGDFVVVCSMASAASLFAMFGLNSAVVRYVAEHLAAGHRAAARHALRLCFSLAALATAGTALALVIGTHLAGQRILHAARAVDVTLLLVAAAAMQAFVNLSAAALRGLGEMKYSSILGGQGGVVGPLASTLFLVVVAVAASIRELSLQSALIAYLISFGLAAAIGAVWLRGAVFSLGGGNDTAPSDHSPPLRMATLVGACVPILLTQLLAITARQGSLWVAGWCCAADDVALYAGATRAILLVSFPLSLVNLSVMSFIPQLRTEGRLPELEQVLRVSAGWAAIPAFATLLAFVVAPAVILEIFLGAYYGDAGALLSILSVGQFLLVWVGSCELTLVLSGHARSAAAVNAVAACVLMAFGPLAAIQLGASGLAVVAALVVAGQSLAQWLLARRLVGVWTHAALRPWRPNHSGP